MPGHDGTQADAYVAVWYQVNRVAVGYTGALILLAALVLSLRHAFRTRPDQASPHLEGDISATEIILVLLWFGLITGLGESYFFMAKTWLWHEMVPGFRQVSSMSLWMAPIASMTVTLVAGMGLLLVKHQGGRAIGMRAASLLGTTLLVLTLTMTTGRLHWAAAALLALGIGVNLSRSMARHAGATMALVRVSVPVLVGIVVLLGIGEQWHDGWRERRAIAEMPPAPVGAPNIIWIVLDTERAESMSLYGFDRPTTPFLERLAEGAVVFDWAIAPESWTLPSHATMFTSRFNTELRAWFHTPLDDTYPTVAEVLRNRGYLTAGFIANFSFMTDEHFGLARGFDHWYDQPLSIAMVTASSWLSRSIAKGVRDLAGVHRLLLTKSADEVVDEFLAWQSQVPDRPYLAFLNFFDVHNPYRPVPRPYLPMTRPNARYWLEKNKGARFYTAEEREGLREHYEASIAYLDSRLQRMFEAMKRRDGLENTMVVITADHGEQFGEHGKMGHISSLYRQTLHVPLLILPVPPLQQGIRVAEPVSLADLPATIVTMAGMEQAPFLGASLARFWAPDSTTARPQPAFAGTWDGALFRDGWHYIRTEDGEELYHLGSDPEELHNLAVDEAPPEALQTLRREVDSLLATSWDPQRGMGRELAGNE